MTKQTKKEMYYYKELQKYVTNVIFYLQSGNNVLTSLELSKNKLDKQIQKDIDKTINGIKKKAQIQTDHFKKYRFKPLNLFHNQLQIKYVMGGDTRELFNKVIENINYEIVKRDELMIRKKSLRNKIYTMMGMVLSIPLLLSISSKTLYNVFLSTGLFATGLNVGIFVLLTVSFVFLQRSANDISL